MSDDYPPGMLAAFHAMRRVARCLGLPQVRPHAFSTPDRTLWCGQVHASFGLWSPSWMRIFGWDVATGEGPRIFGRGDVPTDIRDRLDDALDGAFTARDRGMP